METRDSIGLAFRNLGRHPEAAAAYRRAIEIYRAMGDLFDEADTTVSLGDAHYAAADCNAARDAWDHALTILTDLGHPHATEVQARLTRTADAL